MISLFETGSPLSLYVHVPFCKVKCTYCDFYSLKTVDESSFYIETLQKEVTLLEELYPHIFDIPVHTIFIGGGTPSVLSVEEWKDVARQLHRFNLTAVIEWTVECNPESFTTEKAIAYKESGVNRISFGVQSLQDDELKTIGRIHSASEVVAVLQMPILQEFDAISCDVIYGLPNQQKEDVRKTLEMLTSFATVKHISAYELTIAEGTPLAKLQDRYRFPNDDEMLEIIHCCRDMLQEAGFKRYEISNYAKEGYESLHNSAYWKRTPYLGLGPASHSFDGKYRFANPPSLKQYGETIETGNLAHEEYEEVEAEDELEEFLFLRLRMNKGFSDDEFQKSFGEAFSSNGREEAIELLCSEGVLVHEKGRWLCTERGMDIVDAVALQLCTGSDE